MDSVSAKVKLLVGAVVVLACIPSGICHGFHWPVYEYRGPVLYPLGRPAYFIKPPGTRKSCSNIRPNVDIRYQGPRKTLILPDPPRGAGDIVFPTDPASTEERIVSSGPNIPNPDNSRAELSDRSDVCQGPDGVNGVCTPFARCQPLVNRLVADPMNEALANFLRASNRICGNEYAVVCCPLSSGDRSELTRTSPMRLPTVADGCGQVRHKGENVLGILVVGGRPSKLGAWPWIALLGYETTSPGSPFKCGGTLITKRHILTAAHCIRSDLSFVRLGEHDLSTDTETKHVDIPIEKTVRHPQYNPRDGHSDIALLHLSRDVEYSEFIVPICLPVTPEFRVKPAEDTILSVAGWGRTTEGGEPATALQEVDLPVVNNSLCKDIYEKRMRLFSIRQFDDAVMCVGDLEGGRDTCQGDSGGPLMLGQMIGNEKRFHLYGIVSYSIGCARSEVPGVYTSVVNFIDWIQREITK